MRDPSVRLSGRGNVRDTTATTDASRGNFARSSSAVGRNRDDERKKNARRNAERNSEKVVGFVSQIAGDGNVAGWIVRKKKRL